MRLDIGIRVGVQYLEEPEVGGHAVSGVEHHNVAGHELARQERLQLAVAHAARTQHTYTRRHLIASHIHIARPNRTSQEARST